MALPICLNRKVGEIEKYGWQVGRSPITLAEVRPNRRRSWIVIGLICISSLLIAFAPLPVFHQSPPTHRFFRIEASQFAYSPGAMKVNPGDFVTIELISQDVVHGLYLDGYRLSVQADPGQPARLSFIANRPGSFRFRCNVTCGAMHPFMIGKLTIGTDQWLYRGLGLALLAVMGIFVAFR